MYLAYFCWPQGIEPLCVGKNKKKTHKRACDKAKEIYGTELVNRPGAMCAAKITMDDIEVVQIEAIL